MRGTPVVSRLLWALVPLALTVGMLGPAGPPPAGAAQGPRTAAAAVGYRVVATSGKLSSFGAAAMDVSGGGSAAGTVAVANDPSGGWWTTTWTGAVTAGGGAKPFGSAPMALHAPIVGMAATPDGKGYWLVGADGGVFGFGDAHYLGSTGAMVLDRPVVGMAATPDGRGYWLVASDGGIFAFGDARFQGSLGGRPLDAPIVGMAARPSGPGYWMVAADGGVFAFGGAPFEGSAGGLVLASPVTGMAADPDGGYWLVGSDGGVFSYGAPFEGAVTGSTSPVVGISGMAPPASGPRIVTTTLPDDIAGEFSSITLVASGGQGPYTWSATGLPSWLSLGASSGSLRGRPITPGSTTFDVEVTDRTGERAIARLTLRVITPLALPPVTLPEAVLGQPYLAALHAAGGASPLVWDVSGPLGTIPPGLGIVGGAMAGTPTEAGQFSFTLNVTDADGETATMPAVMQVANLPLTVATTSLTPGMFGSGYSDQLTATGGIGTYTWSATGLPYGLIMSSAGLIWGQVQYTGYYPIATTVTDADGASVTATFVLGLDSTFWIGAPPLPEALIGSGASAGMTVSGGTGPYLWSATGLPQGMTIDPSTGALDGDPSVVGAYVVTAEVTDLFGFAASRTFTLYVAAGPTDLTTTSLPPATVGVPYSFTPTAIGGSAPYTWIISLLPPGLTSDSSTGTISGTPTTAGTYYAEVFVKDVAGLSSQTDLPLTVSPG